MASHSMINECIFDLEKQKVSLDRDLDILNNECDLEKLIGQPGSLYPENVLLWKEYLTQLNKNLHLMTTIGEKLSEELTKFKG